MNSLFHIFILLLTLSPSFIVFAYNSKIFNINPICLILVSISIVLLLTKLSLCLAKLLGGESFEKGSICEVEQASYTYLPSHLGYFFVALSTPRLEVYLLVFSIISVLIFFSDHAYFNPLYFVFGFKFYSVTTKRGVKILIITKKGLRYPEQISFEGIKRINDYTFIDIGKIEKMKEA